MMNYIGCHLSASAGYLAMVKTAESIGANTFAFFTRNPRGSKAKKEDPVDAAKAVAALQVQVFTTDHGLCLGAKDPMDALLVFG